MFGRIFHLLVDAMLVSVALSGIKRSTGLTPAVSRMPNKDLRNLMRIYLEAGEWVSGTASSKSRRDIVGLPSIALTRSRDRSWTSPSSFWADRAPSSESAKLDSACRA